MKNIALNIITHAFANKKDMAGKPYIEHLLRVAEYSKNYYKAGSELSIERIETVALLHDLLEDCPAWTSHHLNAIFNDYIITEAIERLTRTDELSYKEYIENICVYPYARIVKLADLQDNMDLTRLSNITEADIKRNNKYKNSFCKLIEFNTK